MTALSIFLSVPIVLLAFSVIHVISIGLKNYVKKYELLKKSPNLPHAPGGHLIFEHTGLFASQKHNLTTFHAYHKQLGNTYALFNQQNATIMTTDVELIKNINQDHCDRPRISFPFDFLSEDSLINAQGQKWARIRRAITPALSAHKMKSPQVEAEISNILDKLSEMIKSKISSCSLSACGKTNCAEMNLNFSITRYTLDLVFTNFFKQSNLITYTHEKDYWIHQLLCNALPGMVHPVFEFVIKFPVLHTIINWFLMNPEPRTVLPKAIKRFTIEAAKLYGKARHEAELENKHNPAFDFTKVKVIQLNDGTKFERKSLDYIIDRFYDRSLTFTEYIQSVCFLHFAAERTFCDVIIGVIHNLSLHPDVQRKLRHSLAIEGSKSQYMNWVIKETIRLHPPAPLGGARTLRRDVYTQDGLLIPRGSHVYPSVYSIHRLKEYWGEDAEEFRPERWENEKSFHPAQFLGFGLGKRACPGKDLAYVQMSRVIEHLIMKFKFEKSDKSPTSTKFTSPFLMITVMDKSLYVKVSNL